MSNIDLRLLHDVNSIVPNNTVARKLVAATGFNAVLRGSPIFFAILILWFSSDLKRRSRILVGLIATCVATVLSVWLQVHVHWHVRPMLDASIHLQNIEATSVAPINWTHFYSFPSDTGTMYFSLAMLIYLENRVAGAFAFLWALWVAGVIRVAFGWHYPSDIAGAAILGPACVILFSRMGFIRNLFNALILRLEPRIYILHALLFIFLADAYSQFTGLQGLIVGWTR